MDCYVAQRLLLEYSVLLGDQFWLTLIFTAEFYNFSLKKSTLAFRFIMSGKVSSEIKIICAGSDSMSDDYIILYRSEGESCPCCGADIKRIKVSGRSSYICPGCQSK
jgi:hypothetical protein